MTNDEVELIMKVWINCNERRVLLAVNHSVILFSFQESVKISTPYLLVTKDSVIVMGNSDTPITSFCRKVAVSKAVVCLLAVYYSFDLEYPLQAANAYAFLDEFVLNTDPENNSSQYSSMVSKYAKFLSKS